MSDAALAEMYRYYAGRNGNVRAAMSLLHTEAGVAIDETVERIDQPHMLVALAGQVPDYQAPLNGGRDKSNSAQGRMLG